VEVVSWVVGFQVDGSRVVQYGLTILHSEKQQTLNSVHTEHVLVYVSSQGYALWWVIV